MLRDFLALTVGAAHAASPRIAQLLYVLFGDPGEGKSTLLMVLAGGRPGMSDAPRWTDKIDFPMIKEPATASRPRSLLLGSERSYGNSATRRSATPDPRSAASLRI
jgi:GTPase SAR1 family protein